MRWPAAGAVALGLLGACMTPVPVAQGEGPPPPATTGQALAQMACPHRIRQAHAWVNHMPGPNRAARDLVVDVELVEATDTAIMLKSAATTGDMLVLEIRTAPSAPIAGRVAYRAPAPERLYKKVSFFCRGGEIFKLDRIEKVY